MDIIPPDGLEDLVISKCGFEFFNKDPVKNLQIIKEFLHEHACLNNSPYIITIGGTNGKGETCLSLAHYLKNLNISYVLFTSPHILSVRERFKSSEGYISSIDFNHYLEICEKWVNQNRYQLTYYEMLFCLFMLWQKNLKPKVCILEVGLGGRLDAVNAVDCHIASICSISRDHTEILGKRYDLILKEKLGIARSKKILFTSFKLNYLISQTQNFAMENDILWENITPDDFSFSKSNQTLALKILSQTLEFLDLKIPINFNTALSQSFVRGEQYNWRNHLFEFYGSHNLRGLAELFNYLENLNKKFDLAVFAFSNRDTLDIIHMLKAIGMKRSTLFNEVFWASFEHPKAFKKVSSIPDCHVNFQQEWKNIVLPKDSNQKKILISGSYYFVASVKRFLLENNQC